MGKNELYTIKHYTSYTLSHIFFVNSKTSNFYKQQYHHFPDESEDMF